MKSKLAPATNNLTPIASAVALLLMSVTFAAQAQQTGAAAPAPASAGAAQEVVVTGIRASLQQSLNQKRNADSLVEVITAEDIGKMPDKNVADAVQRLPGVNISSAGAGEGGFDENDRVSMRGTSPSLTQTTIDGHMIGSGDWFILNQTGGTVGRSVSYSLLPSELVGTVVVRKSAQADVLEGGVAGSVDIQTRKPLQFKKQLTAEVTLGAVYSDLPKETDPQLSGLINWKNEANTFGVMVQAFSEKRHLRRDGQEMLGYQQISPTSAVAAAHPDLANVWYPNVIGSSLFTQVRERKGGLIDVQFKPTDALTFDLTGFSSHMDATNYNQNYLLWNKKILNDNEESPSTYTVKNGTLVAATWPGVAGNQYITTEAYYRPAYSESSFVNLDAKFKASDRLTISTKLGSSKGAGETKEQDMFAGDIFGTGATYALHGLGSPASASFPNGNPANFNANGMRLNWIWGAAPGGTKDSEKWGQVDNELKLDSGIFTTLKFGGRIADHERSTTWIGQGPKWSEDPFNVANLPQWNGELYPADFGSGLGGGGFPTQVWSLSPATLEAWGRKYSNRSPLERQNWAGEFSLKERASALYAMTNLDGEGWSGNVGVRLVRTEERVMSNVPIAGSVCGVMVPCAVPGAITTSAFGPFYKKEIANNYVDVLPSVNFRFDLRKDLVARVAASKTMARPDFGALGGSINLNDSLGTAEGGNPNLKPVRSNNYDASIEWYFAPRSLLSAGLFHMDLTSYVGYGDTTYNALNQTTNQFQDYKLTAPINSSGQASGLELAYQQPIGAGFGFLGNYTYTKAHETGGNDLQGASKNTYNLTGYFENDRFNARVAYNFRSHFFTSRDRGVNQYQDDVGTVAVSLGYKISENLSLSLDALNLNKPVLKYYVNNNPDQPTAFYQNGRQFYLTLRGKM